MWKRCRAKGPWLLITSPGLWITRWMKLVYTGRSTSLGRRVFLPLCIFLEADLSAKRASAEAPPRLSRADVDARRPRDPEASESPRPEAPLGLKYVGAAPTSAQPFPRFRRRLPARPSGLDPLSRALLVPS